MDTFEQKIISVLNEKLNDGTVEKIIEEKLKRVFQKHLTVCLAIVGKLKRSLKPK